MVKMGAITPGHPPLMRNRKKEIVAEKNKIIKENYAFGFVSEHGRSRCKIKCPFCSDIITVYLWSLAGSGKKCSCGAIHTGGYTIKYEPKLKGASND